MHRSGFVNIIGNPNVGKSTLMNALVGEKLSIITSKAQTTRHRIMGIVSGEDFQIVYSDTPGILKPSYKLQESMMKFVTGALTDADVILYVTDTVEQSERSAEIVDSIRRSGIPTVVVINKIDLSTPEALEALVDKWQAEIPGAQVVPTSAKENFNIEGLFRTILSLLPEGPAFYPKDTLTDKTLRFFASEIIREKILKFYDKEIPYCCEIEIESYKEEPTIDRIAEGHPDRPQGREAEEGRTDGARRHGTVPRQEGFPPVVRQGQRRLAQQRTAITQVRIRTGIINRTESPFKEQNQSACGNSSPESYWEPPCCAARKPTHSTTGNIFSGSDVRA